MLFCVGCTASWIESSLRALHIYQNLEHQNDNITHTLSVVKIGFHHRIPPYYCVFVFFQLLEH